MDTGSVVGIALGSSAATIILVGLLSKGLNLPVEYPAGKPTQTLLEKFSFLNWFKVLYYFLPYGLFLFGIIYDGLIRKIKFFPAGFIGLLAMLLNYGVSSVMNGETLDQDICGVPGMATWGSDVAPQNIVFSTSVLSYLATYITVSQSDSSYSGYAWLGVAIVWAIQTIFFNLNGCNTSKALGWKLSFESDTLMKILPPIYGLAFGLLCGGLSGYLIASYVSVGSGVDVTQPNVLSKGPAMASTSETAGAGKCSSTGGDDDQFVCEAYKNGELVTSTIVE